MRKRYIVLFLSVLIALSFSGCSRNPEKAKRKYLESGMKYMDSKQYEAATIQFKKAIQVDPKFAEAHYELGPAYLKLQRWTMRLIIAMLIGQTALGPVGVQAVSYLHQALSTLVR